MKHSATVLIGVLAGVIAIGTGVFQWCRLMWRAGASSHELISAVRDNTDATGELADELRTLRVDVTGELADHAARITRLETK